MEGQIEPDPGEDRGNLEERLHEAGMRIVKLSAGLDGGAEREDFALPLAEIEAVRRERFGPRPKAAHGEGAKIKLLGHFQLHLGEHLYGEELAAVSGIQEWARRVRELRVEDGYDIEEVGGSTYVLVRAEPNKIRAGQWQLANRIRKAPGSARGRISQFFEVNVGQTVTRAQIDYVAKIKEGSRRLRELRDEEGWPIETHIDDPSLKPSEYRLISTDPKDRRDAAQRLYPDNLREKVFERDAYTCQICGRDKAKAEAAGDKRFYLELHHQVAIADELDELPVGKRNDPSNLITLCHSDHLRETEKMQKEKRARRKPT